ncbi:hypothetical protein [Paenibacillus monticola]|uniref:DUF5709 domain-containing protein n=1 Tax=Paenibacillus monticola TaxID=2666075 RepID=A0A7X2L0Q9_9BACL|nr:hypothetical protein [Paenibacillus monticola]MRN51531.1 hypothetical protein [Paenibacillus monticola]
MGNEFNKTEADFAYERYTKLGDIPPEQDIPVDDLRPVSSLESSLTSHEPVGATPVDFDGIVDDGSDPVLVGDKYLAADIGLNVPDSGLGRRADREESILASPAPERDELLESDAALAAETAGLSEGLIDYDEEPPLDEDEDLPLEDIPDADDIDPESAVDPASPPTDVMPGIDVLNGSQGEED